MKRTRLYWLLLLLALGVPSAARATGSLSIPNTIAAQPTGNVQASLLDTNWTTIASYVNTREVASGTLGSRPAAGTAGRWYFASDDNGGTLYFDFGGGWVQAGPSVSSGSTLAGSQGLVWSTATSTNTTYNGTATRVTLRNPSTGSTVTRTATSTLTNNVLTSGPTANGRDQVAAFTNDSWVHFYYIWNGSSLDTLSSTCSPSDANGACSANFGPVLPSGYTHWAYIGPVRFATTGILNATFITGDFASLEPVVHRACAAGTGAEQTYNVADRTPPNNLGTRVHLVSNANGVQGEVRAVAGGRALMNTNFGGGALGTSGSFATIPIQQTLFFIGNAGGSFCLQTSGYKIPNGGS